ncbi:MAG: Ig-like domain-containing protein, partial [Planctomycetota bacterium]
YSPVAAGAVPIIANVFANDFDPDDATLVLKSFQTTSQCGATVSISAAGAVTYDPSFALRNPNGPCPSGLQELTQGQTVVDTFTYEIVDSLGLTDVATVTVNVTGRNDAPVAVNDTGATDEVTPLVIPAKGLLANDTDAENSPPADANLNLSVSSVEGLSSNVGTTIVLPSGATLLVTSDGAVNYDPSTSASLNRLPVGATFVDTFAYTAFDGTSASTPGTMAITIAGVNDRPTAVADAFATSDNALLSIAAPGILLNDSDVDGDSLRATAFSGASSRGAAITVSTNGAFTYDPRGVAQLQALGVGQSLVDSFIYTIFDGNGGTATSTVTVTVDGTNDTPVAVGDSYRVDEDSKLIVSGIGVLGNDFDPDASDVIVVGTFDVTSSRGAPVSVNPDGTFTYDPTTVALLQQLAPGQSLIDTFTYRVSDGKTLSNTAVVTITVDGRNDAPTAVNDSYSVDEGQQLIVSAANGVLANDTDPEGSPLSASLVTGPTNGSVVLNSSGFFTYTPNANFNGNDSFTYLASDGAASSTGTVTINVRGVNDSPTAFADTYTVSEDGSLTVNAANGVLANDVDVDQESLRAVLVSGTGPTKGSLALNTDGSFTYTPNIGFFGTDSFRYFAQDGAGTSSSPVTVTLNVVNTRPKRNPVNPLDVNADGSVSAIDALLIINEINKNGSHEIPSTTAAVAPFWDVNGDGFVSAIDVLRVVNAINTGVLSEGEGSLPSLDTSLTLERGLATEPGVGSITVLSHVDQAFWGRNLDEVQRPSQRPVTKERGVERFSSPIDAAFAAFSEIAAGRRHHSDLDANDLEGSAVDRLAEDQTEPDSKLLFEAALNDLFGGD